jgi:hypothetical protein
MSVYCCKPVLVFRYRLSPKTFGYNLVSLTGRIILERMLEKCGRYVWTGFIWLRIRTRDLNEPSDSIKEDIFLAS